MRLAVIGDVQHYRDAQGRLCALEPVVAQLDHWAALFDELVLCAPLSPGLPPVGFAPYSAPNLRLVPLRKGGGDNLRAKLAILRLIPTWFVVTRRTAREAGAVHLRCPSNIGLIGLFSTWGAAPLRHGFFAGVWRGYPGEPASYRLQRFLLGSRWFRGPVSVYSPADPAHPKLEPSFSPSINVAQWEAAGPAAEVKVADIRAGRRPQPYRLVTVGRLSDNKNQQCIVRALAVLVDSGVDAHLDILGEGPCLGELEALADSLGVADRCWFRGPVSHPEVMDAFARADIQLLATRQEGFGKVLLEGMVHATVPVFTESPLGEEIAGGGSRGLVFDADDPAALAAAVRSLIDDLPRWAQMAESARSYAGEMTLERFGEGLKAMLERHWHITLRGSAEGAA